MTYPLVKLAFVHYQFEVINPFADGNGRTGRILLLLYLKFTRPMDLPALYMSDYIMNNKTTYYKGLRLVSDEGNWENWILYILGMVESTAIKSMQQIILIEKLMSEVGAKIRTQHPKMYSKDLLEVLFKLPYTKRSSLINAGLGNLKTAGLYLNHLEDRFSEK